MFFLIVYIIFNVLLALSLEWYHSSKNIYIYIYQIFIYRYQIKYNCIYVCILFTYYNIAYKFVQEALSENIIF